MMFRQAHHQRILLVFAIALARRVGEGVWIPAGVGMAGGALRAVCYWPEGGGL